MEEVRVKINMNDYPSDWDLTPASWETWVVGKLKDAGVPVKGKLVFRGIESGELIKQDDYRDFGCSEYIWRGQR